MFNRHPAHGIPDSPGPNRRRWPTGIPAIAAACTAIRGHVFVSFLALTLAKELTRLCQRKGLQPEWQPLLNDLDPLQEATIEKDGKVITTRTHVSGQVGNVFKATGIALPANISELPQRT